MREYVPFLSLEQARQAGFLSEELFPDDEDSVSVKEKRRFILIEDIPDSSLEDPLNILIAMEIEREEKIAVDIIAENYEKNLPFVLCCDNDNETTVVETFLFLSFNNNIPLIEPCLEEKDRKKYDRKQLRIFESHGKRGREPLWRAKRRKIQSSRMKRMYQDVRMSKSL